MPRLPKGRISTNSGDELSARGGPFASVRGQELDKGVSTTPGQVYVFSLSDQDVSLSLNGGAAGTVPGWVTQGTNPFASTVLAVPRTLNASDGRGKFFAGSNQVVGLTDQGPFMCTIKIDNNTYPMNQNLVLYLLLTQFIFLSSFGVTISEGPLKPVNMASQPAL